MLLGSVLAATGFFFTIGQFALVATGSVLVFRHWQRGAGKTSLQGFGQEHGTLVFRERLERELTELSTGFINLPAEQIDEAIRYSLQRVGTVCAVDSCHLWLWDEQHRFVKHAIEWYEAGEDEQNQLWQTLDFHHLCWIRKKLEKALSLRVLGPADFSDEAVGERDFFQQQGITALLLLPIHFDGKVHGIVSMLVCGDREHFLGENIAPFELIADMLASALQQKSSQQRLLEANSQLQILSEVDELTGIANRRYFNHQFSNIIRQASRTGQLVSLLLVDIDYFKKYNDCYGHLQGDTALRKIAQRVDKSFRRADEHAARYGGEEFTVIFAAGSNAELIFEQAKKLRKKIEKLHILHGESKISQFVTVSIGVACLSIQHHDQDRQLIQLTDECLYQAKSDGRNRVIFRDQNGQLHSDVEK